MKITPNKAFKNEVIGKTMEFSLKAAVVHRNNLRESAVKETGTLAKSYKLQVPIVKGDRVITRIVSNNKYRKRVDKIKSHHNKAWQSFTPKNKTAKFGKANKKQANRIYKTTHAADYSRGMYHLKKQGLTVVLALNFEEKAQIKTNKILPVLAKQVFKL